MAKQNSLGWLDQFISKVPKTFGKGVAASDVAQSKPGPVFLGNPYAKEMAKRQTSIGAYDANKKASPAMQQVFTEKANTQAKKKRVRDVLEKGQDVLGKAELLSFIPTPFTQGIGSAAGITNAAISAVLAGQDFSEGNYAGALGNFGAGALGVGVGSIGIRGGLNNVIDDLLPVKGPKNFMSGKSMSSTPGTLGTLKPLEPHQEIGMHAIGDLDYVSDRELKEAYQEALDKFQLTNYRPNVDPFLDHDVEKALAMNVRMKFADRLPKFTDNKYTAAVHGEDPFFFDARGPYSERFFNQQGYDLSKLNPQDRTLMDAYQHGYDSYFNKRPNVHKLPTTLKDYFGELSDQFNTAVQKNKINKDITLNRSVGNYTIDLLDPVTNKSIGKGFRDELQVGDVYKEPGFLSTSLPHYIYGGGKYTDKIIVPGGGVQSYAFPNATSYGQFMGEQEVVLPKGLIRRVEDVPEPGQVVTSILNPYKNGGWLDKYNDGGPVQPNYNDASVSMSKDFVGDGYSNVGRNYSPAWGGQFEDGGQLPQFQPGGKTPIIVNDKNDPRLRAYNDSLTLHNKGKSYLKQGFSQQLYDYAQDLILYGKNKKIAPYKTEKGKSELFIPQYKKPTQPIVYEKPKPQIQPTSQAIIDWIEGNTRDENAPTRLGTSEDYKQYAMGGSMPGAVGFTYARTIGPPAPSNGKYAKKTKASAQDGTTVPGEYELMQEPDDQINYDSENPAFDAASILIGQGLMNSVPEANSPAIDININQRNLKAEHTFSHIPGFSVFTGEPTESYMLKRTVSPYTTDEDVRLNTQIPNRPQDVNFISNYAGARPDPSSEYPTSVPYQGEKHWNIDRFIIDPEFSASYADLENRDVNTDKTQQRRNTLADMYKYFMLQNKGDKDTAWKQANEFMTKEIDPRISGPMYNVLRNDETLTPIKGPSITDIVDINYLRDYNDLANEINLPEQKRSDKGREFIKNPASAKQAKDLAMDWLVNYKKMTPKQAESYYKKLPKNDKEYIKYINSKTKKDKPLYVPTDSNLYPDGGFQNGGEMRYYQEGLDFKPKTISKDGGWLSKYEEGGVIQDDMGQWAHPGEITEIGSNQITMQGVPYPVLGISDTGDTQMMYPDEEYQYEGSSVTEYPIMKQGGQLKKLDQLTNFTNYNTKQPGSWLDKYQ